MKKKILIIGVILSVLLISSSLSLTAMSGENLKTSIKSKNPIFGIKIEGSDDLKASDNKRLVFGTIFPITFNLEVTITSGKIEVGDDTFGKGDTLTIGLFIGQRGQEDTHEGHYIINGRGFGIS